MGSLPQHAAAAAVRNAVAADIPALTAIRGAGSEALHRDRLRDAEDPGFRYPVLLLDDRPIGFACLVIRRPAYWSDAADTEHLPQLVDVQVHPAWRGRGHGSWFLKAVEGIAKSMGHRALYLEVDPWAIRAPTPSIGASDTGPCRRSRCAGPGASSTRGGPGTPARTGPLTW